VVWLVFRGWRAARAVALGSGVYSRTQGVGVVAFPSWLSGRSVRQSTPWRGRRSRWAPTTTTRGLLWPARAPLADGGAVVLACVAGEGVEALSARFYAAQRLASWLRRMLSMTVFTTCLSSSERRVVASN
jgi:hypothetical protein